MRAEILDGKMHVLVHPFACSDAAGHFVIDASDFGVRPEQTADDSMFPDCFYDSSPKRAKPQSIVLSEETPSAEAQIHLPPKVGKVTGSVVSSPRGVVICDGELRLRFTLRSDKSCWF